MKKYLEKYPDQQQDIFTLAYTLGDEEANAICNKAIKEGKQIEIFNDEDKIDLLTYKLK
jgi:hypothetical protein